MTGTWTDDLYDLTEAEFRRKSLGTVRVRVSRDLTLMNEHQLNHSWNSVFREDSDQASETDGIL